MQERESDKPRFAIICDSACDLPPDYLVERGVACVSLHVRIDGDDLLDLGDVDPVDYYARLLEARELPETSHPSPAEYMDALQKAADGGVESALVLTVSGKLSGSYGAALTAARSLSKVLEVRVIDTKLVSAGEAIIVDAAVQARDAGMTMDEVADRIGVVAAATRIYFVPAVPLSKARSGFSRGRASLLLRFLGTKELLTLDGEGNITEDARSADLSDITGRIARLMSRYAGQTGALSYVEACAGRTRPLAMLEKPLDTNEFESERQAILNVCPSLVSHVGVGTIGIAFVPRTLYSATSEGLRSTRAKEAARLQPKASTTVVG